MSYLLHCDVIEFWLIMGVILELVIDIDCNITVSRPLHTISDSIAENF